MRILVTGGCGFIGSHLVRTLLASGHDLLNLDSLSYPANLPALECFEANPRHHFIKADVADFPVLRNALSDFRPDWIFHLAAETHVDRSIDDSGPFLHSNITGTHSLLEAIRSHLGKIGGKSDFRLIHVSTDEVFGQLTAEGSFREDSPYRPRSPYSATKAASDHLVRAWHTTYRIPTIIVHASNNYGPGQHPEKLIPKIIRNALNANSIPIYGNGSQIRDWLHVSDHVEALVRVANYGTIGGSYNIGGQQEFTNLQTATLVCRLLDHLCPRADGSPHASLIAFVDDRPGHDYRYSLDCSLIDRELGWKPSVLFEAGLIDTINHYLTRDSPEL